MKFTVKILALLMAAILACFALAACGESGEGSTTATSFHSGNEYAKADYSKVTVKVSADTPKTMKKVTVDISKGKYDNKVVEIEGLNNLIGNCAQVIQKNSDGTQTAVMYYIINGTYPTDYPAQDAKIRVKGLVVVDSTTGARHLEVPKDKLEIL